MITAMVEEVLCAVPPTIRGHRVEGLPSEDVMSADIKVTKVIARFNMVRILEDIIATIRIRIKIRIKVIIKIRIRIRVRTNKVLPVWFNKVWFRIKVKDL